MKLNPLFKFPYTNTRLDGKLGLVSQFFGENKRMYKEVLGTDGHTGLDLAVPDNTEVIAPIDMFIIETGVDSKGGIYFKGEVIENDELRYELIFVHLKEYFVGPNTWVKKGDVVAWSDNTGWSSGPHLHFATRVKLYDKENNIWYKLKNNFNGYIDPLPFFSDSGYNYSADFMRLPLRQLVGKEDVWVIGIDGKRHLVLNIETFNRGKEMGLWGDFADIEKVNALPEVEGSCIILVSSQ